MFCFTTVSRLYVVLLPYCSILYEFLWLGCKPNSPARVLKQLWQGSTRSLVMCCSQRLTHQARSRAGSSDSRYISHQTVTRSTRSPRSETIHRQLGKNDIKCRQCTRPITFIVLVADDLGMYSGCPAQNTYNYLVPEGFSPSQRVGVYRPQPSRSLIDTLPFVFTYPFKAGV